KLLVENGQEIRAGDQISEGPINPQEYLETRGREAVQRYLVKEVQKVYRSQGVTINDKHIEIIVRQMLRKVRVDQPGDTELLPSERERARREAEEALAGGVLPEREEEYNPFLDAVAAALPAAELENPFVSEAGADSGTADEELAAELEADLEEDKGAELEELEPV